VDDGSSDSRTIQEAINGASPTDTIYIHTDSHNGLNNSDNLKPEFILGEIIL
jgi:hypothetical protein